MREVCSLVYGVCGWFQVGCPRWRKGHAVRTTADCKKRNNRVLPKMHATGAKMHATGAHIVRDKRDKFTASA